jgi:putative acetyltransferase
VATCDHHIVGFGIALPQSDELRALYVAPASIKGAGRALLQELEQQTQHAGGTCLVCDASLNAEAFYLRNGFQVESYTSHTLSSGIAMPSVRMKKSLSAARS